MDPPKTPGEPEMTWQVKQREYEAKKARAKALKLRLTCSICSEKAKLNCPCGTTQYCSTECQRIDWRDRGHRKACKKIRNERAAEAARAEAPTPPSPPPKEVVYGPAPRSHADEIRARIAAEHEAARLRREANPEREPQSARYGSRCPLCLDEWDVNSPGGLFLCCCRKVCASCHNKFGPKHGSKPCPLCQTPCLHTAKEALATLRRHVENEVPEAIAQLGHAYENGLHGLVKNEKKAAKIFKRGVELGNVDAMRLLATLYEQGANGVKQDRKKAEQLSRMAADRGCAISQAIVAHTLYDRGASNFEAAYQYFKLSADQGYTTAQYDVGACLYNGHGVERDRDEAMRWFKSAADTGHEPAKAALAHIKSGEV